jgi:hypothetical protein
MTKHGRGGGAPGKGNPGGERGGNHGRRDEEKNEEKVPRRSSQAAGKDPQRGKPEE